MELNEMKKMAWIKKDWNGMNNLYTHAYIDMSIR